METQELPSLGTHLILDFIQVNSLDVNDLNLLSSHLSTLVTALGETTEQVYNKKFSSGAISIVFMLSNAQLTLHTFPASFSYSIDLHMFDEIDVMEKLRKAEELFCDEFGWKNCTSSIFLQRGKATQFFLNSGCNVGTIFKNMKFVWRERSKFQDIRVYDTMEMGRILILDGNIQISNELEDNYTKDMTEHVVQKDREYEEILIIGGGDLVIPTYLLEKYPGIKHITVVEIDERVCEVVKKFFTAGETVKKEQEAGRFKLIFNDGAEFVKQAIFEGKKFDGIIIDCTDVDFEESAALTLFTVPFYQNILSILKKDALFSQQVSDIQSKVKFEKMIYEAGFRDIKIIFSDTPEYSAPLPIGIARNTVKD